MEPNQWSVRPVPGAWGKYRHTIAYIRAGDGSSKAIFPVKIPGSDLWTLEVHVPQLDFVENNYRGNWELEIVTANGRSAVTYNANQNNIGWNVVGEFELPAGEVLVEFSNKTDGRLVIADAVAWSRKN